MTPTVVRFQIARGEEERRTVEVEITPGQIVRIGRSRVCDVSLPSTILAARMHAIVRYQHGAFWIGDTNTPVGILVNGVRASGECQLHDGDVIRIGDTGLRFEVVAAR